MKRILLLVFLIPLSFACQKDQIEFPTSDCAWRDRTTDHPKTALYRDLLDQFVDQGLPGISLLISKDREDLWVGATGLADLDQQRLLEPCHIFPAGSVGKLFCGTAAMLMVEDGLLDLDAKIADYLSPELAADIPNAQTATIAHLLSHTSGIPDYADNPNVMLDLLNNKDLDFSRENILERYVYGKSPRFKAGAEYAYSNSNYEILTLIMDAVYPKGHADYYSFRLIRRLGLERTFYKGETDYYSLNSRGMANGYFDRFSDGKLENATDLSLNIAAGQTGSDGIICNVVDLFSLLKSVMTADLVRPATLELMKTYIRKKEGFETYKYGLGLVYREYGSYGQALGYSGSAPGYSTEAWYFPERNTYIVFQINAGNLLSGPIQRLIDEDFRTALLQVVFN